MTFLNKIFTWIVNKGIVNNSWSIAEFIYEVLLEYDDESRNYKKNIRLMIYDKDHICYRYFIIKTLIPNIIVQLKMYPRDKNVLWYNNNYKNIKFQVLLSMFNKILDNESYNYILNDLRIILKA